MLDKTPSQYNYVSIRRIRRWKVILLTLFLMGVGLTFYELIKQYVHPQITIWESHLCTIIFGSLLAGIITLFGMRRIDALERRNDSYVKELDEAYQLNLSLMKAIPYGMDVIDADGRILYVSEIQERMTGEKSLGKNCWSVYFDRNAPCEPCPFLSEPMQESGNLVVQGVKGNRVFQVSYARMAYNGQPALLRVFEDVTEQKEAEEALEKSRDFYLTLFENFPSLIWRSGTDAKCNYFNRTWLEFTGRTMEQEMGDGWAGGVHPEDLELCIQTYLQAFENREPCSMVYRLRHVSGEYRWLRDNGQPFYDLDGNFAGFIGSCYDITESRKIRDELQVNEERYRQLIELLPDAVLVHSHEKIIYANTAAVQLLGYNAREALVGQEIMEFVHPDFHSVKRARLQTIMESEESAPLTEEDFVQKSGGIINVEVASRRFEFNGIPSVLSVIRDITERKKFQKALEESEGRYSSLFAGNHSVMLLIDPETGLIIEANDAACKFYGYPKDQMVGMEVSRVNTQTRDAIFDELTKVRKDEKHHFNFKHRLANGEVRDVQVYSGPIRVQGKQLVYSIVHDVTESKRAEDELRKLSRAIEQSASTVVITDTQGVIEYVNPKFTETTGYSAQEALGQNPRILKSGEMPGEEYRKLWEAIASGGEWRGEFHNRRKNGELYWEFATISPIRDGQGRITHFLAVKEDITELKRTTEELHRAKEAAETANRAKSEFLANISHEIRTPMNGVIGMTELLLGTELTQEQREYLEMVQTSADDLLALINDILDFSKIEAGKLELETIEFNLQTLVEKTSETFALRAQNKGLELLCYIDPDIPAKLVGDPRRLRQVLVNLIGNALKFTEKGEIFVKAEQEDEKGDIFVIHFSIRDTGIGIPENKLDRLFKSFSQVDGSTTRKFGGTGLGLAISKNLVELMGGTIGVQSVEGEGSTFYFSIPFGGSRESVEPGISDVSGVRVLVVDDNPTNRYILKEVLTRWGMDVALEENGHHVLERLNEAGTVGSPYRILLLDAQMPGKDGFEVIREIRDDSSHKDLSIMLLSSATVPPAIAERIQADVDCTLLKPVKQSELFDQMMQVLHGNDPAGVQPSVPSETPTASIRARVLLAEDNAINQKLMLALLQKMGCRTRAVFNGRQALEALEEESFDLVLMDMQMPEMDGFEATAGIRKRETERGGHIPIIALTAHVMKGDRERCLEAGMDDYLSKPIKRDELERVIRRYSPTPELPGKAGFHFKSSQTAPMDWDGLLETLNGEVELAVDIVEQYLDESREECRALRTAMDQYDFSAAAAIAHRFKGVSGNLCVERAYKVVSELERMAKESKRDGADELLVELENSIGRLQSWFAQMKSGF